MATVSIIIPVYNTEGYLKSCLESVQRQNFSDFECLVVNDGSTDNSEKIINEFVKSDSRFRLLKQDNAGPSKARNAGIANTTAPWITFVDSDDMIAPNFLETLLSIANDCEIVCSGFRQIADNFHFVSTKNKNAEKKSSVKFWNSEEALTQALYQDNVPDLSAWNKIYARHLWEGISFPVGKYFEDIYTIPEVLLKAKKIASVNAPLYLYRERPTSILHSPYDSKMAELLSIAERTLKIVNDHFQNNPDCNEKKKLIRAAESTIISASFSILMRTGECDLFAEVRTRAFYHIKKLRLQNIFDTNVRFKNKVASILSYLPKRIFLKILERG